MDRPIIEIKNLCKNFSSRKKNMPPVKAVSDISISIQRGETFGLVGESGCGKTTLGRCIVRGIDASEGYIGYYKEDNSEPINFLTLKGSELKRARKDIQMIFQDPYSSLDPRMTVYEIITEPLNEHFKLSKAETDAKVEQIIKATGLNTNYLKRYPHAFSGGQRQRIGIARSLITQPKFIVCDEAVSALDISIQAQIINLLKDLQREFQITYMFISHNLSVVEHISDRVAVMYLGKIVELAQTDRLFMNPKHPYTEALLSAVPKPDPHIKMKRIILEGEVPNPANPPSGCHFHPRCPYKQPMCESQPPILTEVSEGHYAACHFTKELNLMPVRST